MKDRYLMLIFKIVLLGSSKVETDYLMTDGRKIVQADGRKIVQTDGQKIVQTDGNNLLNICIWCHTFLTKKDIFKSTVRTAFATDHRFFFCLSIHIHGQTKSTNDRSLVSYISITKKEF